MTHIDLNMVRAGVVTHPDCWPSAGYREIQSPPARYRLFDIEPLMDALGFPNHEQLVNWQKNAILEAPANAR